MPVAAMARNWIISTRDAVVAASGRGKSAWTWIKFAELESTTFEDLASPGADFISLDDKLSSALSHILTGDVAQDMFNKTESMSKAGEMITGRHSTRS